MNLSDLNDLDFGNIGGWPVLAKFLLIVVLMAAVGGAGYYFDIKDLIVSLETTAAKEPQLKAEFTKRQKVVANLENYRQRLVALQELLAEAVQRLPTRTQMPDLLEQVSATGRTNGLIFELFRPQGEQPKAFYAAVPIAIKARATYHQFAAFVSAISALDRIVTLENAKLGVRKGQGRGAEEGTRKDDLLIEATLQTYRYLDADETATQ